MTEQIQKVQAAVAVKHTITVTQAANIGLGIAIGLLLFAVIFGCGLLLLFVVVSSTGMRAL